MAEKHFLSQHNLLNSIHASFLGWFTICQFSCMNIHFLLLGLNLSNYKDMISARQKVRIDFKLQIFKGDVNIGTIIVPQTFQKASVKNGNLVPEN